MPLSTVFQIRYEPYDALFVSNGVEQTFITFNGFSMRMLIATSITNDMMVTTAHKFSSDKPSVEPITFFAKIARKAEETLDNIAATNPNHVKLDSDADAIPYEPIALSKHPPTLEEQRKERIRHEREERRRKEEAELNDEEERAEEARLAALYKGPAEDAAAGETAASPIRSSITPLELTRTSTII